MKYNVYINIRHLLNIHHVCLSWTRMTLLSSNLPEFFDPIYTPPYMELGSVWTGGPQKARHMVIK